MIPKFGDVEGNVGNIHDNPFGVGTLLSSPFMNIDVLHRFANLIGLNLHDYESGTGSRKHGCCLLRGGDIAFGVSRY
jgi:hypothetical protein